MKFPTILAALALAGCASVPSSNTPEPPDMSGIIPISDDGGPRGHVCPISQHYAFTAGHVSGWNFINMKGEVVRIHGKLFAQQGDLACQLREWAYDEYRDFGVVKIESCHFPISYKVATEMPKKGDKLTIRGFNVRKGFIGGLFEVEVVSTEMGYVYFRPEGDPGSSGSCALNEKGEIVAINVHGFNVPGTQGRRTIGSATLVVGRFGLPRIPDFPEDPCNEW